MISYVEAPEQWHRRPGAGVGIFLAGGITGCPDWQARALRIIDVCTADADAVTVLNPRRSDFDVTDPSAAEKQVRWEYEHLHRAHVTMFWFPACDPSVTVQPIAMFELGSALGQAREQSNRRFVVGADPAYPRRADVRFQIDNVLGSAFPVASTLEETCGAALAEADRVRHEWTVR